MVCKGFEHDATVKHQFISSFRKKILAWWCLGAEEGVGTMPFNKILKCHFVIAMNPSDIGPYSLLLKTGDRSIEHNMWIFPSFFLYLSCLLIYQSLLFHICSIQEVLTQNYAVLHASGNYFVVLANCSVFFLCSTRILCTFDRWKIYETSCRRREIWGLHWSLG